MTKKQEAIKNWLLDRPGYLKCSPKIIFKNYGIKSTTKDIEIALQQARLSIKKVDIIKNIDISKIVNKIHVKDKINIFKPTIQTNKDKINNKFYLYLFE